MLTISQLATYAGVTVRAVRHYHQRGLLPEPERDSSGYRRYDGEAVISVIRIRTLANAGVPLARVAELLRSEPDAFAAALGEIDRELRDRIASLEQHRRDLAQLPSAERLALPDQVAELLVRSRAAGVGERTLRLEREGWILLLATFPDLLPAALDWKNAALDDPDYRALMIRYEEAYDWVAEDPRLLPLAQDSMAAIDALYPWDEAERQVALVISDVAGYRMMAEHNQDVSPAWRRVNDLLDQLMIDRGYPVP